MWFKIGRTHTHTNKQTEQPYGLWWRVANSIANIIHHIYFNSFPVTVTAKAFCEHTFISVMSRLYKTQLFYRIFKLTSENYWRLASRVTEVVIRGTPYIIFSLAILCSWQTHTHHENTSIARFAYSSVILARVNWLKVSWCSLANNNRGHQFPDTRYLPHRI